MKQRLDILLVEKGLAESREKAKALIMSGVVYVNEQKEDKAGTEFDTESVIRVAEQLKYVSRGGLKLEKAMKTYGITLENKICADIGASTGGFTDCMLQCGAEKVYSVDVGHGQLAWSLQTNPKVVVLDRTNARYLDEKLIPDKIDFYSMDVAFISVRLTIPPITALLSEGGEAVILIKPQFEAGREKVGKNGVVRDKEVHKEVVRGITDFLKETGYGIRGLEYSPIKGPKGNIEYLAYVKLGAESIDYDVDAIVEESHEVLKEAK